MGRPRKYFSEEDRREARRKQTRLSVRAWRTRQRYENDRASSGDESHDQQREDSLVRLVQRGMRDSVKPQDESSLLLSRSRSPSPQQADMLYHSCMPPIDLTFGCLEALVHEYHSTANKCVPWNLLLEPTTANDMLRVAVAGVAFEFMGRKYSNQAMLQKSYTAYHDASNYLQLRLQQGNIAHDAVWLYSICVALFWVDVTESAFTTRMGTIKNTTKLPTWITHWRASAEILRSAGADAFDSELGRLVLRKTWFSLVFLGTIDKETAFVTNTESWRTLFPRDSHIADLFCFFGIKLPGFLGRVDALLNSKAKTPGRESPSDGLTQAQDLYDDLGQHKEELQTWLAKFTAQQNNGTGLNILFSGLDELQDLSNARIGDLEAHCPSVFDDVSVAELMLAYWFCMLQLSMAMMKTRDYICRTPSRESSATSQEDDEEIRHLEIGDADLIASQILALSHSLVDQYLTRFCGIMFSVSAPIRVAMQFYIQHRPPQYADKLRRCIAFIDQYARTEKSGAINGYCVETLFGHVQGLWIREDTERLLAQTAVAT